MSHIRVIPTLLVKDGGLYKGSHFKHHKYVGDPINAIKIFNEKEVDELTVLDINATPSGVGPNFELLRDMASEAFMPLSYGGGFTDISDIERVFKLGFEKVVLNTAAFLKPDLVSEVSRMAGSQSTVISIDVRKPLFGDYEVYVKCGAQRTRTGPVEFARHVEELGAGEIILCSIDREGTGRGYDIELIRKVTGAVNIPVVALGGAGSLEDFALATREGNASAVAAGDMFVFHGKHQAVLITYPSQDELAALQV